jgi:hypothetical protein
VVLAIISPAGMGFVEGKYPFVDFRMENVPLYSSAAWFYMDTVNDWWETPMDVFFGNLGHLSVSGCMDDGCEIVFRSSTEVMENLDQPFDMRISFWSVVDEVIP